MIKEYGAINGFTMETYETLHKDAVKNPHGFNDGRSASNRVLIAITIVQW